MLSVFHIVIILTKIWQITSISVIMHGPGELVSWSVFIFAKT